MKKVLIVSMCFFLLFVYGCKSTADTPVEENEVLPEVEPAPTPEVEPEVTEPEIVVPEVDYAAENKVLIDSVMEARQCAIDAGAEKYFSVELKALDVLSDKALTDYENGGNPEEFKAIALSSLSDYEAIGQASRVYESREKAIAAGAEDYFNLELQSLDAQGLKAVDDYKETKEREPFDYVCSELLYAYDSVEKACNVYVAREAAIMSGAEEYFASELLVMDVAANEALSVYTNGGSKDTFDAASNNLLYQYKALEQASYLAINRAKIEKYGFEKYDPALYNEGISSIEKAYELFETGSDGEDLYEETKKANNALIEVLYQGFSVLAKTEKDAYDDLKSSADDIKANVADKENYYVAADVYDRGLAAISAKEAEVAVDYFADAKNKMSEVYENVFEKRRAAQEAIDRAKMKIQQAVEMAAKADSLIPQENVTTEGAE